MADNTETITFNNDTISDGQGNTFTVTGSAVVDYSTGSYDYSWKLTKPDGEYVDGREYSNGGFVPNANGNYTLGGGTFNTTYNGMQPTSAISMVFTGSTPNYTGSGGSVTSTPGGTVTPLCFATGTLIQTLRGDVPVEALTAGDHAVTASGAIRPIVWIGHKIVDCTAQAVPSKLWPVRIRAGAFGSCGGSVVPERDLYLSPGHPVRVGEGAEAHLVPIMCLINGTSIERVPVDSVTYWHVELDEHDLLLAEGVAAESYLDWGDRPWFANAGDHALMNPDFVVPGLTGRCLPVALDGPLVEAERRRLDAVFASQLDSACGWPSAASALTLI